MKEKNDSKYDYTGKAVTVEGKIIRKVIKWTSPSPSKVRKLRMIISLESKDGSFISCSYLYDENSAVLPESLKIGAWIKVSGHKISDSILIESFQYIRNCP